MCMRAPRLVPSSVKDAPPDIQILAGSELVITGASNVKVLSMVPSVAPTVSIIDS